MNNAMMTVVSVDNNTAEVVLELHGRSLIRPDASSAAIANISSKQARRIAIQLLEAAQEMDEQRNVLLSRQNS